MVAVCMTSFAGTGEASRGQVGAAPTTREGPTAAERESLARLRRDYTLTGGQAVRIVTAPFPASREEFLATRRNLPEGRMLDALDWLLVTDPGDGTLSPTMYPGGNGADTAVRAVLRLRWWEVELGMELPRLPNPVDLVVREGASREALVSGLETELSRVLGTDVSLARTERRRLSLVLRGEMRASGVKTRRGSELVVVSRRIPSPEELKEWGARTPGLPEGWGVASGIASASERIGVPVLYEPDDAGRVRREFGRTRVAVAPDADVDPTDPDLRGKLEDLVACIESQVGGDWRVEERATEVWRVERKK